MKKKITTINKFLEIKVKKLQKIKGFEHCKLGHIDDGIELENNNDSVVLRFEDLSDFPGCCGIMVAHDLGDDDWTLDDAKIPEIVLQFVFEVYLEIQCLIFGIHNSLKLLSRDTSSNVNVVTLELFSLSYSSQECYIKGLINCINRGLPFEILKEFRNRKTNNKVILGCINY
jgi:hypothetical protein